MEEGAISQGMWVALKAAKSQECGFCPRLSERTADLLIRWALSQTHVGLLQSSKIANLCYLNHHACNLLEQQ
jgi:hypothetical protein